MSTSAARLLIQWLVVVALALVGCGRGGVLPTDPPADPGAASRIDVVVTRDGQPVAGAGCTLLDRIGHAVGTAQTDDQGSAKFANVPPGSEYSIKAEKAGATGLVGNLRVIGGTGPVLARITLTIGTGPTAVVLGTVTDAVTGRPVADVIVHVGDLRTATAQDGTFRVTGVPAGAATLTAEASGFNPISRDLVVGAGSSETVDLALEEGADGPRAGHTIVTTFRAILEVDTWHNVLTRLSTQESWSATYVPGAGSLLIADAGRWGGQAVEVSAAGTRMATFDAATLGILGHVKGIHGAVRLPSGNTLICDTGNNRVVEVDPANKVAWEFRGGLRAPRWAERLASGNTLVCDTGNNRVIEVTRGGAIVFTIGDGSRDILNHPGHATWLPESRTYLVSDSGNDRVMEIDRNLEVVWMAGGSRPVEGGALNNPSSALRLPGGNTLIADTDNNRVIEVDNDLDLVWKLAVPAPLFADRI